jgi:uncharacterized protein (UPF0276 family)
MRQLSSGDRFGLGWRPPLAAGILAHLDRIDVVEVIADDHLGASRRALRPLRTLAAQLPVLLHGVTLGLASTVPVETGRLDRMARLIDAVEPESWSEHLAFTRGGGVEIGHLAAPPRSLASAEGACRNLAMARRVIGTLPSVENIATLIDPPASTMGEPEWIDAVIRGSGAGLLLDLHNLYANAVNFGADPVRTMRRLPLDRVDSVHLGGGHWIEGPSGTRRLLDDHLHDPPPELFQLLAELGRLAPQPLTVILERDGNYPGFTQILEQLDQARASLAEGRRQAAA